MPGLLAGFPVGARERQPHIDVSLSSSLPLYKNKISLKSKIFNIQKLKLRTKPEGKVTHFEIKSNSCNYEIAR